MEEMNEYNKLDIQAGAQSAGILLGIAAMAVTIVLLFQMLTAVGRPMNIGMKNAAVADTYSMALSNHMSNALEEVAASKKTYWIGEDALVAPKPNPLNFGSTTDPQELENVIRRAAPLLDGQELFFKSDIEFWPGSQVEYYRDDTILSLTWKQDINHCVYTITEVKIGHPSQFRRFMSGGEFGSGKLYLTSEMAAAVNAVVAHSADYYNYRPQGITIYNGLLRKNHVGMSDICYVDDKGNLLLETGQQKLTDDQVNAYIAENHINFSLAFGPIIIKDGNLCVPDRYYFGEINEYFARAGIAQLGELHYVIMNANDELGAWRWPTVREFAQVMARTGCDRAYTLDGGQTATTVVNNRVINHVSYGSERRISDIIYFATAIPDGG